MGHENEYYDNMVTMLELIWGEGYMAPGGPGNVARMLEGTSPGSKRILDIGCGSGRHTCAAYGLPNTVAIGADLSHARALTVEQLEMAEGNSQTIVPEGLPRPDHWFYTN